MKVIICDDELNQIEAIRLLLQSAVKHSNTSIEIHEYQNPKTMLFETESAEEWPDLLCLDVNMPQMTGIDVARAMRKRGQRTQILFFSVLQDVRILLQAFDVQATNYFIKEDMDVERFNRVFTDCVKRADEEKQEALVFSCAGESRSVLIKSINYFEVNHRIITVHYGKNESFEFYSQLERIAETLRDRGFLRTHRSFLVSKSAITQVASKEVTLITGETIPLSRSCAQQVRAEFNLCGQEEE